MGRVLAAQPRSASQTSPGTGFVEQIENFLLNGPGTTQVKHVRVRHFDNLGNPYTGFRCHLRPPLPQSVVERFGKYVHFSSSSHPGSNLSSPKDRSRDRRLPEQPVMLSPSAKCRFRLLGRSRGLIGDSCLADVPVGAAARPGSRVLTVNFHTDAARGPECARASPPPVVNRVQRNVVPPRIGYRPHHLERLVPVERHDPHRTQLERKAAPPPQAVDRTASPESRPHSRHEMASFRRVSAANDQPVAGSCKR
jgi:hypothetical protein